MTTRTGVLDRLVYKGLIRRDVVQDDRGVTSMTGEGTRLFRKTFAVHTTFLLPFFERALNQQNVDMGRRRLLHQGTAFTATSEQPTASNA